MVLLSHLVFWVGGRAAPSFRLAECPVSARPVLQGLKLPERPWEVKEICKNTCSYVDLFSEHKNTFLCAQAPTGHWGELQAGRGSPAESLTEIRQARNIAALSLF